MANLQSLLLPISALGNQSTVKLSPGLKALDSQGQSSVAVEALDDEALNAEHSFSQLLNDSADPKPISDDKPRLLTRAEADLGSVSFSDVGTTELTSLSGNKFPIQGQTLPPATSLVSEELAEGFYQISADQQNSPAISQNLLNPPLDVGLQAASTIPELVESFEPQTVAVEKLNEAPLAAAQPGDQSNNEQSETRASPFVNKAENIASVDMVLTEASLASEINDPSGNPTKDREPLPFLNSSLQNGDALPEIGGTIFPEIQQSSVTPDSVSNDSSKVQADPSLLLANSTAAELTAKDLLTNSQVSAEGQERLNMQGPLADIESGPVDTLLPESRENLSKINAQQISDPNVRASQVGGSAAASSMAMDLPNAINSDELRQVRNKGVDFLSMLDVSSSAQESEAEFSKFEGVTYSQGSVVGEKAIQLMSGNLLGTAAVDVGAPQIQPVSNNTSLTNALSQWRVEQDSVAVNTAPLERHAFTKLSVPFNQSGWGENLGRQLSLLVAKNMDSAQIQLDPPELGPLGVKIQINQDQVSLQFTSGHAVVREALEQSSQRLQQMLNDEGLELVDVGVSDRKSGQNNDSNQDHEQGEAKSTLGESSLDRTEESDGLLTPIRNMAIDDGNIDYFI